jgi:hypothetical protein
MNVYHPDHKIYSMPNQSTIPLDGRWMLTNILKPCILRMYHPYTIPEDGNQKECTMSSLHQIDVQLVHGSDSPLEIATAPPQTGDYTINIQASEEWVITGKYRDNMLCALTLNRQTHPESEVESYGGN